MYPYVYEAVGLSQLGLDEDKARKIVLEVLDYVTQGLSSKPDVETVLRRIKRFRPQVNELISAKLLELSEKPSIEQLEFIVLNGGRAIIGEISRLYKLARDYGREDLVSFLRYNWEKYGIRSPVQCPRCGFYSVMPDYSCYICGAVVSEKYVREQLGFEEKFSEFLKLSSIAELRLSIERGYVLLGEDGVYNPLYKPSKPAVLFQIYLKPSETARIIEEINSRDLPI
ncbi:hypothetical protein ACSU1N_01465 [Thermogladius sp. 4427co]|uniref:hypothetical protein n=1 Tax=Thermogladius sp. 4427co TaxID=3450718 RepID=UPI003F79AE07